IRLALPPLMHVTLKRSSEGKGGSEPNTSVAPNQPAALVDYPDVKVEMPFPAMAELITWPMIKDIVDQDTPIEDLEGRFIEIREEFNQAVVEWRDRVGQDLVDIWNTGRAEDDEVEAKPGPSTNKGKGKATARTSTRRSTRKVESSSSSTRTKGTKASPHSVDFVFFQVDLDSC
ncbi:hypothetical protein FRC06_010210, partial [Ceratobasidium sp. 370]